ncbi:MULTISPECIES: hypothetical protein [unclassified Rhizobium]|uniref:hypothetical protein n=1 Tax=unclassified Rhizobium TaxID=2613769 RepID=UPI000713BFB3|nr:MULTISPECIES: hypothetical protein [unclassified Rhizobium]KQS90394.1 hypothetical protein ASG50_08075 [Rhizobium sp. Leaf386]KQS90701.1 hypothetical protein ASG42_09205 [Rhizobium sp. Leaf391]KQU10135.1 hypothetical protein ASG68_03945 [Rhizobium sp. Leaf453]
MKHAELIKRLTSLKQPSRGLDGEIGLLIGYTRSVRVEIHPASQRQTSAAVWHTPANKETRLPFYTKLMNDAYTFAQTALPEQSGGLSWDDAGGSARMGKGPYITAANAAIALCIAVLGNMQQEEQEEDVEVEEVDIETD